MGFTKPKWVSGFGFLPEPTIKKQQQQHCCAAAAQVLAGQPRWPAVHGSQPAAASDRPPAAVNDSPPAAVWPPAADHPERGRVRERKREEGEIGGATWGVAAGGGGGRRRRPAAWSDFSPSWVAQREGEMLEREKESEEREID